MALSSLGLIIIGSIPTVIGVAEAMSAQKQQNQQAKERIKFFLTAKFTDVNSPIKEATVVLRNGKVRKKPSYYHPLFHFLLLWLLQRPPGQVQSQDVVEQLIERYSVSLSRCLFCFGRTIWDTRVGQES